MFNIFKKEKPKKETRINEVQEKPKRRVGEVIVEKTEGRKKIGEAYRVLKSGHITEKATDLTGENQYVFKVALDSNKTEIKKAIVDLYGVEVERVNIVKIPGKRRRLGKSEGWREGLKKGYKKAIVKIKEGQKIEVLPR